jgi:hypothetical protein
MTKEEIEALFISHGLIRAINKWEMRRDDRIKLERGFEKIACLNFSICPYR